MEGRLIARAARNLTRILTGEVDPVSLLFADETLSDFYANSHPHQQLLARAAEEVKLMVHKNPAMRVLEIGTGTGSATDHILGALGDNFNEYVYTDQSTSFFSKVRDRLTSPKLTYKTLDISQNPLAQGYEEGQFDLIIATNVSPQSPSCQQSLTCPGATRRQWHSERTNPFPYLAHIEWANPASGRDKL
jgi:protein-L-isoaspartate O-methyltransferase